MSGNSNSRIRAFEIADRLFDNGAAVTVSAVRQAMDGREFYSKTFRELEQWRQEKQDIDGPAPDIPLLDDVEHTFKLVMEIIWRSAVVQARDEMRKLRDSVTGRVNELEAALSDALNEIARLENETQFKEQHLNEALAKLQQTEAVLTTRENESDALQQRIGEVYERERTLVDKIEVLAARAGAAEAEVRTLKENRRMALEQATLGGETLPPSH